MGFRKDAYATVWEVKPGNGNWDDARMSISRKDKNTGDYYTEWSGWVRLIGDAHNDSHLLGEKTRIKLGDCDVTNKYDKEKQTTYTNYALFGFELADNDGGSQQSSSSQPTADADGFMNIPDDIDDELPFV